MQGSIVAVGGRKGNIFMVELAHRLAQSQKNDKGLLTAVSIWFFDSLQYFHKYTMKT